MQTLGNLLTIIDKDNEQVVSSLEISKALGIEHDTLIKTISNYQSKIELFGIIRFEIEKTQSAGRPPKIYYLTEDQAIFIATLSRNNEQVVNFKAILTKSFSNVRKAITAQKQIPQNYIEALKAHLEDQEKILELENKIDQDKDKVEFAETLLDTTNALDMATCAKALHLPYGRNILFDKLRLLNILDRKNRPYQPFVTNGYFVIVESSFVHPKTGDNILTTKTMVTAKGQQYLIKKLKDTGDRI